MKQTNILELIVIGIPAVLMATSMITLYWTVTILPGFILQNVDMMTVSMIGCILLGCELVRFINNMR